MKNLEKLLNLINEIKESGNPNLEVSKSDNCQQYIGYYNEEVDYDFEKDEEIIEQKGVILEINKFNGKEEITCSTDNVNDFTGGSIEIIDLDNCYNLFENINNSYQAAQ